ncbi:hypothetical protein ACPF8X_41280, partial [Streptomyces sp. G35A]
PSMTPHEAFMLRFVPGLRPKVRHATPFSRLAREIPPAMRARLLRNVTLDHRLGFTSMRRFGSLEQALEWAESDVGYAWANKRFQRRLGLDDLLACTGFPVPEPVISRLRQLLPGAGGIQAG